MEMRCRSAHDLHNDDWKTLVASGVRIGQEGSVASYVSGDLRVGFTVSVSRGRGRF